MKKTAIKIATDIKEICIPLYKILIPFVFIIKIGIGFCLIWVYNDYYPNKTKISKEEFRDQADIFKYYDDSKIIYNALEERPIDFLKIIFSIDNNTNISTIIITST